MSEYIAAATREDTFAELLRLSYDGVALADILHGQTGDPALARAAHDLRAAADEQERANLRPRLQVVTKRSE